MTTQSTANGEYIEFLTPPPTPPDFLLEQQVSFLLKELETVENTARRLTQRVHRQRRELRRLNREHNGSLLLAKLRAAEDAYAAVVALLVEEEAKPAKNWFQRLFGGK